MDLDRRQFHRLVLGASTAGLLGAACDRQYSRRMAEIGRAVIGEGPNRIVTGRLTATAGAAEGEVFAVVGYQKTYNNMVRGPANGSYTIDHATGVLQRPASIGAHDGPVQLAAAIRNVWKVGKDAYACLSLDNVRRYAVAAELEGTRLFSYAAGDLITVFGRIDTPAGGARGIYATADVIIGDLNEFVRRI